MANGQAIQESLFNAMETIVTQRVDNLEVDKTIIGIVKKNIGLRNNRPLYQIWYSGGLMEAVCLNENDLYQPETAVYVLIPRGNFSKEKIIMGLAYAKDVTGKKNVNFEKYAKTGINLVNFENDTYGLHSWHDDNSIYDTDISHMKQKLYFSYNQEISDIYKDDMIAIAIQADFQTNLDVLQTQNPGRYGLIFKFAFDKTNGESDYKYEQFVLDSNNMVGNPFLYNQWNTQYKIFEIDGKTFHHLDEVLFFQEGFNKDWSNEQNMPVSNPGSADILVKNIAIYPLTNMAELNNYSLKVEPYNNNFVVEDENSTLQFKATFLRQYAEDLTASNNTKFYWFKKSSAITSFDSPGYNYLAGLGWEQIDNSSWIFSTTTEENISYKNDYKCIAIYADVIVLNYLFSIYNPAKNIQIKLESDSGTDFSFDTGVPAISVKIKEPGESEFSELGYNKNIAYPKYKYHWCVEYNDDKFFLDATNQDTISAIIAEEILDGVQEKIFINNSYIDSFDSNYTTRIYYPIKNIVNNVTIICYVSELNEKMRSYYDIGSAEIVLTNTKSNLTNDYKIQILNDNQLFKYDIYGKAPTDVSNKNPLTIQPLEAIFSTTNEVEIEPNSYTVEWIFPAENSLLIPANNEDNKCYFDIEKEYDPSCINNQITCHISYKDKNFYKDTNFYFIKEGGNGTNGTDIVAKVEYARDDDYYDILSKEPVTLYVYNNQSFINTDVTRILSSTQVFFQNTETINVNPYITPIFKTSLYQKSKLLEYTCYTKYSLAGNKEGKYFETGSHVFWKGDKDFSTLPLIQNIKTEIKLNDSETYYAFISIPIIKYENEFNPKSTKELISIDKQYYLNEIIYNADGRNPIYNHNQGLKLNLPDNITMVQYIAKGGFNKFWLDDERYRSSEDTPCFSLLESKDSQNKNYIYTKVNDDKNIIYILPNDVYEGSITNNRIEAKCYNGNTLVATVYAPINMTLDTFGLASLNAWDGNTVTIDNEGGYILAPQIGAGEKDNNNRFTGILMGKTETYTGGVTQEKQIGLFGYSSGLQSIFLDAKTGNATFGLPDGYRLNTNNGISIPIKDEDNYGEGRIELRPGGESKIGGWKIGRRSLYYTMKPTPIYDLGTNKITNYLIDNNGDYQYNYSGEIGPRYTDDEETPRGRQYAEHHAKDIGLHDSGILLSSDPPYMSIVGTMLTQNDITGDEETNVYLKQGDSIEIQLDPQTPTVFTIFRHNSEFRKQEAAKNNKFLGDRTFLAGINSRGQLQANIIGSSEDNGNQASMYFGLTKRFNQSNEDNTQYTGAIFETGNNSIIKPYFKLLVNKNDLEDDNLEVSIDKVFLDVPNIIHIGAAGDKIYFDQTTFTGGNYSITTNSLKDTIDECLTIIGGITPSEIATESEINGILVEEGWNLPSNSNLNNG